MEMKPMKLLTEWAFEPAKIHRGYSKETLYVGLGNKDGNYSFEKRPAHPGRLQRRCTTIRSVL